MMRSLSVVFALGLCVLTAAFAAHFFFAPTAAPPSAEVATASSEPAPVQQILPKIELTQSAAATPASNDGACKANRVNDISYLIFWPPLPGANDESLAVGEFATSLGTTGDGKTRQLGFGMGIPIWAPDDSMIVQEIKQGFATAKRTNVAVHFNVDDHIGWDARPELWNWYDPARIGYDPENKKNVEWYDWEGTPNKRRYFNPNGSALKTPHMCYNSVAVEKEIHRLVADVVGPALRKEIDALRQEDKEYLFSGITVGQEAGFDDYSNIPKSMQIPANADPMQKQIAEMIIQAEAMMNEDDAPHERLGYCALTNAGYSKANPPADINRALAAIDQKFLEYWDRQFFDAGIPCSRLYTHVAAGPAQDDNNNAPLGIVFNSYARPGWTTYPLGTLEKGFEPLYAELAKHGNPIWGGVEANPSIGNPNPATAVGWERYLAWHYNHGAKLVGINVGATDEALMSVLSKGAFGDEAMATYKKFLKGEPLSEAAASAADGSTSGAAATPLDEGRQPLVETLKTVQREASAWVDGRPERQLKLDPLLQRLDGSLKANNMAQARQTAELILSIVRAKDPVN